MVTEYTVWCRYLYERQSILYIIISAFLIKAGNLLYDITIHRRRIRSGRSGFGPTNFFENNLLFINIGIEHTYIDYHTPTPKSYEY